MGERAHRKLDVWRRSIHLVKTIQKLSERFPVQARFGLSQHIMRTAISVPSNIAEGAARIGKKEKLHFFNIAQGSLSELDTQIEIGYVFNYIDKDSYNNILKEIEIITRKLYGLSRSVKLHNV